MRESPLSQHEEQRLQTLRSLNLMDTAPEERFDRVVRIAARLFDVPIAIFSLIDRHRLWFKARHGFEQAEYPREASFCDYMLQHDGMLVIANPASDARFAHLPALSGPSPLRFYAGAPIRPLTAPRLER